MKRKKKYRIGQKKKNKFGTNVVFSKTNRWSKVKENIKGSAKYVPAAALVGVGAIGIVGAKQTKGILKEAIKWAKKVNPKVFYKKHKVVEGALSKAAAHEALTAYVKGAQKLSNKKIFGIRVGKFLSGVEASIDKSTYTKKIPNLGSNVLNKIVSKIPSKRAKNLSDKLSAYVVTNKKQMKIVVKGKDSAQHAVRHYNIFTENKPSVERLNVHMVKRKLAQMHGNECHNKKIFTPEIKKIMSDYTTNLDTKEKLIKEVDPFAGHLFERAFRGSKFYKSAEYFKGDKTKMWTDTLSRTKGIAQDILLTPAKVYAPLVNKFFKGFTILGAAGVSSGTAYGISTGVRYKKKKRKHIIKS